MRIGVVCEGPTDFPAIREFYKNSLIKRGIDCEFYSIFPQLDKTRPVGGWGNVLTWLKNNGSEMRIQKYFGGGLLAGSLSTEPYDAILIQLDADVVDDRLFQDYVGKHLQIAIQPATKPADRAKQIIDVICKAADFSSMSESDVARHLAAVAVETTETWCIAAFYAQTSEYEELRGQGLTDAFMKALETSESRSANDSYVNVDKNPARRARFCEKHANGSERIEVSCPHYLKSLESLSNLR